MVANINPTTGIAYGYISGKALDGELESTLLFGPQAVNETANAAFTDWKEEFVDREGREPDERDEQGFWDEYEDYEPFITGDLDGVTYASSWLGGALNFFIFKSPVTTDKARLASPCVPNAGILDTLDGSVTSYDVPADWRHVRQH